MKKRRFKAKFFPIMLIMAILLTVSGIYNYSKGTASFLGNAAGFIVVPIRSFADFIGEKIDNIVIHFEKTDNLHRENLELKEEIKKLQKETEKMPVIQSENIWLRSFLELKRERTDFNLTDARIIAKGGESFLTSFTLDKGSFHGIEKNMTVISEENILVGIITEVGLTYSRGFSLLHYDFAAGVYIERTSVPCVLSGDFSLLSAGICMIKGLPEETDIVPGDTVYTSGLGGVLPKDLYIGKVTEIVPDPLTYTIGAIVEPSFDLISLDRVMVVTSYESYYE